MNTGSAINMEIYSIKIPIVRQIRVSSDGV